MKIQKKEKNWIEESLEKMGEKPEDFACEDIECEEKKREQAEKELNKRLEPAKKVAEKTKEEDHVEEGKPLKEEKESITSYDVKDRKELASLLEELHLTAKDVSIKRSVKEGCRYQVTLKSVLNETKGLEEKQPLTEDTHDSLVGKKVFWKDEEATIENVSKDEDGDVFFNLSNGKEISPFTAWEKGTLTSDDKDVINFFKVEVNDEPEEKEETPKEKSRGERLENEPKALAEEDFYNNFKDLFKSIEKAFNNGEYVRPCEKAYYNAYLKLKNSKVATKNRRLSQTIASTYKGDVDELIDWLKKAVTSIQVVASDSTFDGTTKEVDELNKRDNTSYNLTTGNNREGDSYVVYLTSNNEILKDMPKEVRTWTALKNTGKFGPQSEMENTRVYSEKDNKITSNSIVKDLLYNYKFHLGEYNENKNVKEDMNTNIKNLDKLAQELSDYVYENGAYYDIYAEGNEIIACIDWGDWKHDHLWFDHIAREFLEDRGYKVVDIDTTVTEDDGSDTYSAIHTITLATNEDKSLDEAITFEVNDDGDLVAKSKDNYLIIGSEEDKSLSDAEKKKRMLKVLKDFKNDDMMKSEYDYWMSVLKESLDEAYGESGDYKVRVYNILWNEPSDLDAEYELGIDEEDPQYQEKISAWKKEHIENLPNELELTIKASDEIENNNDLYLAVEDELYNKYEYPKGFKIEILNKPTLNIPDGFVKFEGYPTEVGEVGRELITKDGEHIWITDYTEDDGGFWASRNKSDIKTGRGNYWPKDRIKFVSENIVEESLKEEKSRINSFDDLIKQCYRDYLDKLANQGRSEEDIDDVNEVIEWIADDIVDYYKDDLMRVTDIEWDLTTSKGIDELYKHIEAHLPVFLDESIKDMDIKGIRHGDYEEDYIDMSSLDEVKYTELLSKKLISPIDKLYHCTPLSNLDSIKKYGLKTSVKKLWNMSKEGRIYLAIEPDDAVDYCNYAFQWGNTEETDSVLLEIDVKDLDLNYLYVDTNEEENSYIIDGQLNLMSLEYRKDIPASNIKVVKTITDESLNEDKETFKVYLDKLNNLKTKEDAEKYFKDSKDWPEGVAHARDAGNISDAEYNKLFNKMTKICDMFGIDESNSITEDKEDDDFEDDDIDDDFGVSISDVPEETIVDTDEAIDWLSLDEEEAIEGYDEVIDNIDDEHLKDQLEHIRDEEVAHKEFLDAAKEDPSVSYEDFEHEEEDDDSEEDEEESDDEFGVYESLSDKELVQSLVANGSCGDEKEAKERVARMSKQDKDSLSKSIKAQAMKSLLDD